jgi:hypothetical protein
MHFRMIAYAAAACAAIASGAARADQLVLAGQTVAVEAPPGYCAFDRNRPEEAARIEAQEKAHAGLNRLVLAFVDCQDLARNRQSGDYDFASYGVILVPLQSGEVRKATGVTRREFVQKAAQQFPGFDPGDAIETAKKRLNDAGAAVNGVRMLGVLAQDDTALYFGIGLEGVGNAEQGTQHRVLGIVGVTLVNQVPISINLYRVDAEDSAIPELLARDRASVEALLQANAGVEADAERWVVMGVDLGGVANAALIGGLAGALVAAVGYLLRRRRGSGT